MMNLNYHLIYWIISKKETKSNQKLTNIDEVEVWITINNLNIETHLIQLVLSKWEKPHNYKKEYRRMKESLTFKKPNLKDQNLYKT